MGAIDWPLLAILVAANGAPVLAARVMGTRGARPIDFGLRLPDGRPLFGSHKSWRGLVCGIAAAGLVGALTPRGFVAGASCGLLSLYGDLISSFLKRGLKLPVGRHVPLLDQVPEAAMPLLAYSMVDRAALASCAVFIVGGSLVDAMTARWSRRRA